MNLPNKLTLLRMILVPVVVVLTLVEFPHHWICAGVVFIVAAITDALDGNIARKRGLVTDFGKLMDPIADKLLVIAAFVCFITVELPGTWVSGPICSPWVVIIILAREFLVTSARMIYAERGTVIAANIWGKLKTVFQLTAIITIFILMYGLELLSMFNVNLPIIADIVGVVFVVLTWLSALITVISGGTYLYQCRDLLKDAK